MITITIPKEIAKKGDLIVMSCKEYEEFSRWRAFIGSFKTFTPTAAEKRDLKKAREDYKKGNYISIDELKRKLGIKG